MSSSSGNETDKDQIFDAIVIGCGISGLMTARELIRVGKSFLILEDSDGIGGIWHSLAKPASKLQHDSHYYLLNTFFATPEFPSSSIHGEVSRDTVLKMLDAFARYHGINQKIHFRTRVKRFEVDDKASSNQAAHQAVVSVFTEPCASPNRDHLPAFVESTESPSIVSSSAASAPSNARSRVYRCRDLFVCTGSLSGEARHFKEWDRADERKRINYVQIRSYPELFRAHQVRHLTVMGAGSSAVETVLAALQHGVESVTMVYHHHVGFYFNSPINELVYGAGLIIPPAWWIWVYNWLTWLLAIVFYRTKLPPIEYDDAHLYPFSSALIAAYSKGKVKLEKQLTPEMEKKTDLIIEAMGFRNALRQFDMEEKKLTNLNMIYDRPSKPLHHVYFVGFIHEGAGTVPISVRLELLYLMHCLKRGIQPHPNHVHTSYLSGYQYVRLLQRTFGIFDLEVWSQLIQFGLRTVMASLKWIVLKA